ncbi:MAG TPA: hypothetical protein VFU48_10425 [Nitrospira sp.]|nr:hypothetical protein [Nitrospira sp.]
MHEFIIVAKPIHYRADIVAGPGLLDKGRSSRMEGSQRRCSLPNRWILRATLPKHFFPWLSAFLTAGVSSAAA